MPIVPRLAHLLTDGGGVERPAGGVGDGGAEQHALAFGHAAGDEFGLECVFPRLISAASALLAAQCKGARAMLGLGVRDLAKLAGVSSNTVSRLERGEELGVRTVQAIRSALEDAGIVLIDENGGGAGVRLAKRKARAKR